MKTLNIRILDIRGTRGSRQLVSTYRNEIVFSCDSATDENMLNQCKDFAVKKGFTHFKGVIERFFSQQSFKGKLKFTIGHPYSVIDTVGKILSVGSEQECLGFILENSLKNALNGKISELLFVQKNYQ